MRHILLVLFGIFDVLSFVLLHQRGVILFVLDRLLSVCSGLAIGKSLWWFLLVVFEFVSNGRQVVNGFVSGVEIGLVRDVRFREVPGDQDDAILSESGGTWI